MPNQSLSNLISKYLSVDRVYSSKYLHCSHLSPVLQDEQVHSNSVHDEPSLRAQRPPFWHGLLSHGSNTEMVRKENKIK